MNQTGGSPARSALAAWRTPALAVQSGLAGLAALLLLMFSDIAYADPVQGFPPGLLPGLLGLLAGVAGLAAWLHPRFPVPVTVAIILVEAVAAWNLLELMVRAILLPEIAMTAVAFAFALALDLVAVFVLFLAALDMIAWLRGRPLPKGAHNSNDEPGPGPRGLFGAPWPGSRLALHIVAGQAAFLIGFTLLFFIGALASEYQKDRAIGLMLASWTAALAAPLVVAWFWYRRSPAAASWLLLPAQGFVWLMSTWAFSMQVAEPQAIESFLDVLWPTIPLALLSTASLLAAALAAMTLYKEYWATPRGEAA